MSGILCSRKFKDVENLVISRILWSRELSNVEFYVPDGEFSDVGNFMFLRI